MVEPRLKSELSGFRTQAHSFYTMGWGDLEKELSRSSAALIMICFPSRWAPVLPWHSLMLLAGVGIARLFFSLASNFLLQQCKRMSRIQLENFCFQCGTRSFLLLHTLSPYISSPPYTPPTAPPYTLQPHHILPPQDLLFIHPFIYYCHIITCIKHVYVTSLGLVQGRQPTSHIRSY